MAFDAADLAQLAEFIGGEIEKKLASSQAAVAQNRVATVGIPDVPADAGPEFYVHLANGDVVTTHDSSSTHLAAADGSTVQVIGRYQKGV